MKKRLVLVIALCGAVCGIAVADDPPTPVLKSYEAPVGMNSGWVSHSGMGGEPEVVFAGVVTERLAPWLRLTFSDVVLSGNPGAGNGSYLRITSLFDDAVQYLDGVSIVEWSDTSAYFNGDALLVELIAYPGTGPSAFSIPFVTAGDPFNGGIASICGTTDDRVLSQDPRSARLFPAGCSAWIINDKNNGMLTAGHCGPSGNSVIQFNVPLSLGNGTPVNPPPQHQYPVDALSISSSGGGGVGNDWSYFGCQKNSNTGKTVFQAQGAYYVLSGVVPGVQGQTIRITGYGVTSSFLAPLTWSQVQKTHTGPYVAKNGNALGYQVDTTGGNSGSAVHNLATDEAIGIHTHGGCTSTGGFNQGTAADHFGLKNALANPKGVNVPTMASCYANCNGDGVLNIDDFICFQLKFATGDPSANCDGNINADYSVKLDINDYICFQLKFALGCP